MNSYPQRLSQLIENFGLMKDNNERIALLMDYAGHFQEVPERIATRPFPKEHQVPFCESEAYVWLEKQPDKRMQLYFAVENPQGISAKALATILNETLSGLPAEQIADISPDLVYKIFGRNISMGKGQGLMAMVSMVRTVARQLIQH
ncbi:MAG: SufE family protein [bacterium]